MVVFKTFVDYKVFDNITEEDDISLSELAGKVGGEQELLERFSAFLVAANILASPTPGHIAHTDKSRPYRSGEVPGGFIVHVFVMLFRPVAQLLAFFKQHSQASPSNASVTPMGLAMGHPDKDAQGGLDEARPIIVSIGGSSGRALLDIIIFDDFVPAERYAIFELPHAIEDTKKNLGEGLSSAQLVDGSMFEDFPHPVRGPLVYHFRRVLNEFPDEDVLRALRRDREAAAFDTRLLIIEELLAADIVKFSVAQDITLFCVGSKQRNAAMHSKVAGRAGFRLNSEYDDKGMDEQLGWGGTMARNLVVTGLTQEAVLRAGTLPPGPKLEPLNSRMPPPNTEGPKIPMEDPNGTKKTVLPTCAADIRAHTRNSLRLVLDCIMTTDTMRLCYAAMGRAGGRYVALEPYSEAVAATRAVVRPDWILDPERTWDGLHLTA
ncbi:Enoyl reductase LovC [Cytospora mali]|uniref:Enoyl reductase LovC n=1 Tax=Cytospora mali TaxID=578113 RepID=A0A194W6Y8_CYTMA|nr:Enoyl reductase LovC [Valsa mali]